MDSVLSWDAYRDPRLLEVEERRVLPGRGTGEAPGPG